MKTKLLLLLFFIGIYSAKAQYTAIPDINFEQALISQGYDSGAIDHQVLTANINKITTLNVSNKSIADLTGIQDFVALSELFCSSNQLTSLNVSGLKSLTYLSCVRNQLLTSLDMSGLTSLTYLICEGNQLTSLNVSGLANLQHLFCVSNQLTSLNVSGLTNLQTLYCYNNPLLSSLNVSGLTNLQTLDCYDNPSLSCIQVDDVAVAEKGWGKDAEAIFSTNCASLATSNPLITPHAVTVFPNPAKELLNIQSNSLILKTEMYDTNGRTVLSSNQNSENVVLNISSLTNGLYVLKLTTDEGSSIHKIVKAH